MRLLYCTKAGFASSLPLSWIEEGGREGSRFNIGNSRIYRIPQRHEGFYRYVGEGSWFVGRIIFQNLTRLTPNGYLHQNDHFAYLLHPRRRGARLSPTAPTRRPPWRFSSRPSSPPSRTAPSSAPSSSFLLTCRFGMRTQLRGLL